MKELLDMEGEQQKLFVENGHEIEKLVNSGLKIQELLGMGREQQKLFVEKGFHVENLINSGLKMQELLVMEREQQEFFIENVYQVEGLVDSGLDISNRQESNITNDNDLIWFDNTDYNLSEVDLMSLD